MFGQRGNDSLNGGAGNDELLGGMGNDSLHGGADDDVISGHEGDDLARGGDGNDRIFGGLGNDILLGDGGVDTIFGESGRDLLIGGRGADRLDGAGGMDILIAGFTTFDANDTALKMLLAEWTSARTYTARVANLRGLLNADFDARLNSMNYLRKGKTVFDDDAVDVLTGSSDRDWFLYSALAPVIDTITDVTGNEALN